jgi:hypothetical protein
LTAIIGLAVNLVHIMFGRDILDQIIIDYAIIIRCIFASVLIVLFIINLREYNMLKFLYSSIILTVITMLLDNLVKLIIYGINIYWTPKAYGTFGLRWS